MQHSRSFYSLTDLINMGRTPAQARQMIADGQHWIAHKNGNRKQINFPNNK